MRAGRIHENVVTPAARGKVTVHRLRSEQAFAEDALFPVGEGGVGLFTESAFERCVVGVPFLEAPAAPKQRKLIEKREDRRKRIRKHARAKKTALRAQVHLFVPIHFAHSNPTKHALRRAERP